VPNATLTSCDAAFERARMIKTKPEIDLMRKAAQGTDEAIGRAFKAAKPGIKEHALARVLIDSLFEAGQGDFRDMWWGVAAGPNILTTLYGAGARALAPGDAVRVNVRSTFRGYFSHLYRMGVVGAPSDRQSSYYAKGRDIHYRSIERLRPGARACDLFKAAKKDIDEAGVATKGAHVGHSTGIALHENPRLQALDQTVLEPGMVIAAEPIVVDEDRCIYHIEDLVLVTDGAPEILSNRTNTERLIEIH
jgi:Xaa-Pro aminopeptidase